MSELAEAFFIKHKPVSVDFHVPEQKQVAKGRKQCKTQKSKCKIVEVKKVLKILQGIGFPSAITSYFVSSLLSSSPFISFALRRIFLDSEDI